MNLVKGISHRRRWSDAVMEGRSQLIEYRRYFDDKTKISKSESSYRIEKKVNRSESVWIFPFKSALPSEMEIKTNDKEVFRAAFYDVQTNFPKNVKMFEPITNGYQIKNFNTDY